MSWYKIADIREIPIEKDTNKISEPSNTLLVCPFCKETNFDAPGLKSHLTQGDCEIFNNTETIKRIW